MPARSSTWIIGSGTSRSRFAVAVTGLAVLGALASSAPAFAAPTQVPIVGECYDLSDDVLRAGGWWADTAAVPCTEAHTFQVTETGLIPADANAFEFAARQCGELDVWTSVRVNIPVAGVIADPVRIEPRSFGVRLAPATYVCGAVAVELNGREPRNAVSLSSTVEQLSRKDKRALRYCTDGTITPRPRPTTPTVPCTSRPRWQVESWVVWSAFFDEYPGRATLRTRAAELCGPEATASVPTLAQWNRGLARSWCYRQLS